ncbi:metallophosphoesterase [Microlunatus sp. Gsoil 973]|uniref:metallophosphoesterase n=1 Tax=Microlunatus sp. Gsoil 973 TaxID=2672569 RepID=UPI0018A81CD6|nr:metallophosphoesterase [Microlunatus sp. Gsoil 973]
MTDPIFSFGLLADVQYADDDTHEGLDRHFRASISKLQKAVAEFNRHDLAFVVHLGDLVDHDLENATPVLEIMAGSVAPVHQVLGNHDFASSWSPTGRSDSAALIKAYGMQAAYYAIAQPGWRFLVLDTNEVGVIAHPPGSTEASEGEELLARVKSQGRRNANPWNGTIGRAQRSWLADQLEQAAADGLRAAIFAHHPVFPDHHDNLLDDHELLDWLAGFDALKVWFGGHQHAGGYGLYRDVHVLTLNAVVQSTTNAFAVANVHQDRIVITGHGRQPSYELVIN